MTNMQHLFDGSFSSDRKIPTVDFAAHIVFSGFEMDDVL